MDINYKTDTKGYLDITFGPKWDYIALTRPYVENFLLINMANKDNIHKVGTAASELLENATKYSSRDGIRMIVKKSEADGVISLSVFNFSDKSQADFLMKRVAEMNSTDAFEYYIFRMKESIKNKKDSAGLGLSRIYYEGEARISVKYYESDGIVEVNALFDI
jgi:hypothetical protein